MAEIKLEIYDYYGYKFPDLEIVSNDADEETLKEQFDQSRKWLFDIENSSCPPSKINVEMIPIEAFREGGIQKKVRKCLININGRINSPGIVTTLTDTEKLTNTTDIIQLKFT